MADINVIQIKLSQEAQSLFRTAIHTEDSHCVTGEINKSTENIVEVDEIIWLQKQLPDGKHLYKILEKCEIILPRPKEEERNPELEARIQQLKKKEEEKQYKSMTKNVDSVRVRHPEDSIAYQVKEMNRQLIGVLQVLFSVITGFVFGFIGIEWIVGNLETGHRILLGIIAALIIGVADRKSVV